MNRALLSSPAASLRRLAGVGLLLCGTLAYADGQDYSVKQTKLQCGDAEIVAERDCMLVADVGVQCRQQKVTLTTADKTAKVLALDNKLVKKKQAGSTKVLDGLVTGWSCVKAKDGSPYLMLAYTCSSGEEKGACAKGNREWIQLFALDGRHVTAGLGRQDAKKRDALYRKLGLNEAMEAGIEMQGVD